MSGSDDEWGDAPTTVSPRESWFPSEDTKNLVEAILYRDSTQREYGDSDDEATGGYFTINDGCDEKDQVNFILNAIPISSSSACAPGDSLPSNDPLALLVSEKACTTNKIITDNDSPPVADCKCEHAAASVLPTITRAVSPTGDTSQKYVTPEAIPRLYYREYVYPKVSASLDDDNAGLSSDDDCFSTSSSEASKKQYFRTGESVCYEDEGNSCEILPAFDAGTVRQSLIVVECADEEELITADYVDDENVIQEENEIVAVPVKTRHATNIERHFDAVLENPERDVIPDEIKSEGDKKKLIDTTPVPVCVDVAQKVAAADGSTPEKTRCEPAEKVEKSPPVSSGRPRPPTAWTPKISQLKSNTIKEPNDASILLTAIDFKNSYTFDMIMAASDASGNGSMYGGDSVYEESVKDLEKTDHCVPNCSKVLSPELKADSTFIHVTTEANENSLPAWLPEKDQAVNSQHYISSNVSTEWGNVSDESDKKKPTPTTTGGLLKTDRRPWSKKNGKFERPMTTPGEFYREAEHTTNDIRSILDSLPDDEKDALLKTSAVNLVDNINELIEDVRSKTINEFSQLAPSNDAGMQNLIDTIDDFFALGDYTKTARPQEFQRLALPALLHATRPNVLLVQRNAAGKTFAFVLTMCLRVAQHKLTQQRQSRSLAYVSRKPILQHTNIKGALSASSVKWNDFCERCVKLRSDSDGDLSGWSRISSEYQRAAYHDDNDADNCGNVEKVDGSGSDWSVGKSSKKTKKRYDRDNVCPPIEPRIVVICPTRELVDQVYTDARRLTRQWTPQVNIVHTFGGQSYHKLRHTVALLQGSVDILICTLGRLQDDPNLSTICFSRCIMLICDDIDHLTGSMRSTKEYAEFLLRIELDRARRTDVNLNDKNIAADDKLQIILATATNTPECISKARVQMQNVGVVVGATEMPQPVVPHRVVVACDASHKKAVLGELMTQIFSENADAKVLVFVNLKKMLRDVQYMLVSYSPLFRVLMPEAAAAGKTRDELYDCIETLEGGMRAFERADVFKSFANGVSTSATAASVAAKNDSMKKQLKILVSTDVMCRGIDIPDITHVINFNLPQRMEVFTNRLGRCGRLGNVASAFTIFQLKNRQDERALLSLMPIIRDMLPADEQLPRELETVYAHALSHYRGGGNIKLQVEDGDVELDTAAAATNRWRVEREHELFEQICDDPQYLAKQVILNMGFWL